MKFGRTTVEKGRQPVKQVMQITHPSYWELSWQCDYPKRFNDSMMPYIARPPPNILTLRGNRRISFIYDRKTCYIYINRYPMWTTFGTFHIQ